MHQMISNGIQLISSFLNQPAVKEGVKNVAGVMSSAFGVVEVYQIIGGKPVSTLADPQSPKWLQTAGKVAALSGKISLLLSAGCSRPGVFMISKIVGCAFTATQLQRVFGPNTIFAINPWHPRHVASIVAFALGNVQLAYEGINWVCRKVYLADTKVSLMILFNTLTSRVTLHVGNLLAERLR